MSEPVLLAGGLVTLDVVYAKGDTRATLTAGGTAANVAAVASWLGVRSHLLARLGRDAAARVARLDLARFGVGLDFARLPPTAATPIIVERHWRDDSGECRHAFWPRCPRCRRRLPGFSPLRLDTVGAARDAIPRPDVFFFDRDAPGMLALARHAREAGALVVFEPSSDKGRGFREALAVAHVIKYSRERLPQLAERTDPPHGALLEIETLGEDGLRYRSRLADPTNGWRALPAIPTPAIVDAAGAGDFCTAGLLKLAGRAGLAGFEALTSERLEAALRYGQALATWSCRFTGARGGMYEHAGPDLGAFLGATLGPGYPAPVPRSGVISPWSASLERAMRVLCPSCRPSKAGARLPSGRWRTIERPGYVGRQAGQARAEQDGRFGPGRWRIAYAWGEEIIDRDEALGHYAEAYRVYLARHPDVLDWLVTNARDVYDIEPRDIESGTNFSIQKAAATHLQDIAIRIAVQHLGRRFEGRELIQVRGRRSTGHRLNPGVVPFHEPGLIVKPELVGWWSPGSIESFWQSNKLLQVRRDKILLFGGSFNPIHDAHLALARHARDALGFDRVLFIPNGDNYRKPGLAPGAVRLEMVAAAIQGQRGFEVLDVEVASRQSMRTVVTSREIRAGNPHDHLYLLRGLDALHRTHRGLFEISGLRVLVVDRAHSLSFEEILAEHAHLRDNRDRIDYAPGAFALDLSASNVRAAVAGGLQIQGMVPPAVAELIRARGLYQP